MTTERPRASARPAPAEEPEATSFTRSGLAWSEIAALVDGTYRVRLGGLLRSAWMVGVCQGLARHGLSISRAHARRLVHDGSWIAELHVHVLAQPDPTDPLDLPVIAFAEDLPIGNADPLSLRGYALLPSTDHGGTLRLNLSAQDSLGLLGSLLAALASLSLLPVEMHIETRAREAHDTLWLAATGDGPTRPDETDRQALDRLLRASVQH